MVKLLQTALVSAILATGGFANSPTENAAVMSTIDHNTKIFGDIGIASSAGKLEIQPRPSDTKPPFVYTYGDISTSLASATITTNAEAAKTDTPANFYNGYEFTKGESDVSISGGIDDKITIAENVHVWHLSVLRSLFHNNRDNVSNKIANGEEINVADARQPVFLISPQSEDQMGMTNFIGDNPLKLVSTNDTATFNIIMRGPKDTDDEKWTNEGFSSGVSFRDLKLSILREVQGSATLMGRCELTADADVTIPTSLTSAEIDNSLTNIGTNDGVKTESIINADGHKVTFTGDLDFSSHGVKLQCNGGVIICKKGIKI